MLLRGVNSLSIPRMSVSIILRSIHIITPMRLASVDVADMMMSSNGHIFRVGGHLCGEFTGHRWIPAQRQVTRSFDVFFDLCLKKGWVNNRAAGDLRRHRAHYDVIVMSYEIWSLTSKKMCFFLHTRYWIAFSQIPFTLLVGFTPKMYTPFYTSLHMFMVVFIVSLFL